MGNKRFLSSNKIFGINLFLFNLNGFYIIGDYFLGDIEVLTKRKPPNIFILSSLLKNIALSFFICQSNFIILNTDII